MEVMLQPGFVKWAPSCFA